MILAHPNMSAEQACNVARRDGLLLIHTKRGNYRYEPAAPQFPGSPGGPSSRTLAADAAGPQEAA